MFSALLDLPNAVLDRLLHVTPSPRRPNPVLAWAYVLLYCATAAVMLPCAALCLIGGSLLYADVLAATAGLSALVALRVLRALR